MLIGVLVFCCCLGLSTTHGLPYRNQKFNYSHIVSKQRAWTQQRWKHRKHLPKKQKRSKTDQITFLPFASPRDRWAVDKHCGWRLALEHISLTQAAASGDWGLWRCRGVAKRTDLETSRCLPEECTSGASWLETVYHGSHQTGRSNGIGAQDIDIIQLVAAAPGERA